MQETWEKETTNTEIEGILFIHHGNPKETKKYGGVSIALSKQAKAAWKRAGQPAPILPPPTAEATRIMAIELSFQDRKQKTSKYFSLHVTCRTLNLQMKNTTIHLNN